MDGRAGNRAEFPAAELQGGAFELLRRFRDDVDDAVEGVKSIHDRGGPFEHFDALDLRQGDRQRLPEYETLAVDVYRPAVHHDQDLVGEELIVSARADVEVGTGHLHDVKSRHAAEHGGYVCCA
jgi:hypothetical protein